MSDIKIFENDAQSVEVGLENETVWLRQEKMAQFFERDRIVIDCHIRNLFREGELEEESNMQKMHVAGADRPTAFYSLDVIIYVDYRVKSQQGVRFRQLVTRMLCEHLTQRYSLNEGRMTQRIFMKIGQFVGQAKAAASKDFLVVLQKWCLAVQADAVGVRQGSTGHAVR